MISRCLILAVLTTTMLEIHATFQQNYYEELISFQDQICSGSDVLFHKYQVELIRCSLACENDNLCSGFTRRDSDGKCVGCQGGNGILVSIDTGMKYFVPRYRKWGHECDAYYECVGDNQQCMDGVCVCSPGYSFREATWSCTASCSPYGDTFQKYPGHVIELYNYQQTYEPSADVCQEMCRSNQNCISFEYSPTLTYCNLSSKTVLDAPSEYKSYPDFDYYNRNCK